MPTDLLSNLSGLPEPVDSQAVERNLENWRAFWADPDNSDRQARAGSAGQFIDAVEPLLVSVFGNSPFLSSIILRDPEVLLQIISAGPDHTMASINAEIVAAKAAAEMSTDQLARYLRTAKRRTALTVALADLTGIWDGAKTTEALSDFAEAAIDASCAHLMRQGVDRGDIAPINKDTPSATDGLVVLGMGKLGSRELNYSSDIDLILLYDEQRTAYQGRKSIQDFFVKLARGLVQLLDTPTADGYVFRTDLRLRPDPGSTPLALSVTAAETYYESLGQNWERLAMIKARPVGGDRDAGEAFLETITPFIWRRNLDFATLNDIHAIKRQINAHRGGGEVAIAGHNIKLGRGGIREIEFFAQTQQLIWGGRYRALRSRRTCETLAGLVEQGLLDGSTENELVDSYWYLRRLEHRLQMIADQQTHTLPDSADGLAGIATFMGAPSLEAFSEELGRHLNRVADHYSGLFQEHEDQPSEARSAAGNLVFTGVEDDPETLETLKGIGFDRPETISQLIRGWHHGRLRATRSTRARQILTEIKEDLLRAFSKTADPGGAFLRFHEFLSNLPAGVQLFSLFKSEPRLLDLVAEIMGTAPRLADYLSRQAHLLDAVITEGFLRPLPDKAGLRATLDHEMAVSHDLQDCLDITRRWSGDVKFQVSVQTMRGMQDADSAGQVLSDVADLAVATMLTAVQDEMKRRYGIIPGSDVAIIGLGKLGSQALMRGSDLDLVMVYSNPEGHGYSNGDKPLAPSTYYSRLCQRLITAVSAQTGEGLLYEVDMRLRPMGNDGPLVSELSGVGRYYAEDAWTWEHMALTRARVVVGPEPIRSELEAIFQSTLTAERDSDSLLRDVLEMRNRIANEHRTDDPWRLKHVRGGLIDIEFLTQYLQLRHARQHPGILASHTGRALGNLVDHGLLDKKRGSVLIEADRLYRSVQAILRLCLADSLDEDTAPEGLRNVLARVGGTVDLATLKHKLLATQTAVREAFEIEIERPADDLQNTQSIAEN